MIGVIRKGDVVMIKPRGAYDHKMSAEIEAKILDYIEKGATKFLLELSWVRGILSRGVHSLVEIYGRAKEKGGVVKLAGLQRDVRFVLEFARLNEVFEIHPTAKEALESFGITDGPRRHKGKRGDWS